MIDRLQELFDQWETQEVFPATLRLDVLCRARLAAHEWIAYLVQHGDFAGRVPQIALSIWVEQEKLCCLIAENSNGFKYASTPDAAVPEERNGTVRERGLGWFIMQASTDDMRYRPLGNQGFEITFFIRNEDVPKDPSS